jgi:hypothetical protein
MSKASCQRLAAAQAEMMELKAISESKIISKHAIWMMQKNQPRWLKTLEDRPCLGKKNVFQPS